MSEFFAQCRDGSIEISLSTIEANFENVGFSKEEISRILRPIREQIALRLLHEAQQHPTQGNVRFLMKGKYSIGVSIHKKAIDELHARDVQKAQAIISQCQSGFFDALQELDELLLYQIHPDEVGLAPQTLQDWKRKEKVQHAQKLLEKYRKEKSWVDGRKLFSLMKHYALEESDLDSTSGEIETVFLESFAGRA